MAYRRRRRHYRKYRPRRSYKPTRRYKFWKKFSKSQPIKKFYKLRRFVVRHPVLSSVVSMVSAILLVRVSMSDVVFGTNVSEFRLWFLFFAILLGIIGFISLMVWFRNNVSDMTTRHTINWKKR